MASNQNNTFRKLRKKYPVFIFEDYSWEVADNILYVRYHFNVSDKYHFHPQYKIPLKHWLLDPTANMLYQNLIFHIGMVELVSYWKATCSPKIIVRPHYLSEDQRGWWKHLYFHGLGEFLYLNGIHTDEKSLVEIECDADVKTRLRDSSQVQQQGVIIPIGGGKDSLATLNILTESPLPKVAFAINPGEATLRSVESAGLGSQFFTAHRILDPILLELNNKGFLNGHTPFSALVAFVGALAAAITRMRYIALSNESSANEATIPGTMINHQYSKSYDFEFRFNSYLHRSITSQIDYFSLLRPLNELQIASIFSSRRGHLPVFRSCNAGSKTNSWCCNCSKCLFTCIMLAPFLNRNELMDIFGQDIFAKESLITELEQLCGLAKEKPFECVGTIEEVNAALSHLVHTTAEEDLPLLLRYYASKTRNIRFSSLQDQLNFWNPVHGIPSEFIGLVKKSLSQSINAKNDGQTIL
ncbi:MAG: hypothetical protein ACOC12_02215 [Bacteroidota bacterium]